MQERTHVTADRHSVAVGRDLNITITYSELQERLERRRRDPHALTCPWCKLAGLPPDLDRCLVCGHDIGAERRAREAKHARERKLRRAMADMRRVICYGASLALMIALTRWRGHMHEIDVFSVIVSTGFFGIVGGELLVQGWIHVECWLLYDVPRLLRRWGLDWLLPDGH